MIYPVYVILFRQTGLDYVQIAHLLAIWAAAVAVLEIPSGVLADLWSRRLSVCIALLLKAGGFLVWLLRPDFAGFALGFVLWGFQEALCSGTVDALLYDGLKAVGREDSFERIAGWGLAVARAAIGLALVLGGWVFSHNPAIVLVASSAAMVLGAAAALFMTDSRPDRNGRPQRHGQQTEPGGKRRVQGAAFDLWGAVREIGRTVRDAWAVAGLVPFVLFAGFTVTVYGVLDEYDFLFGTLHGVPVAWIGVWGLLRFTLEGIGGALAPRVARRLGGADLRPLVAWIATAGILVVIGTLWMRPVLLPFYFVFYGMMAAAEVLVQGHIQRRIGSSGRATVSSIVSSVSTLFGIAQILLLGWISETFSLQLIFPAGGIMIIGGSAVYLVVLLLKQGRWTGSPPTAADS